MGLRVLRILKPFMALIPEIESPERKVPFNEKLIYTIATLIGFLVMSQVPLYGIKSSDGSDPLFGARVVTAASRGTLMELGVIPILTSGMIMQFLAGTNILHVDYSLKKDRALFGGAQKLFAVVIAIVQAVLLVLSGLYGNPSEIGTLGCALLVGQVVIASIITMLLDELLQKGYGLGSGINIFVASSITQSIFWKILSLSTIATIRGNEYEGSLIALVHLIASRRDKTRALKDAFYRTDLPNFMNTIAAIAAFAAAVYLQGFRVELPVKSNRLRGQSNSYPIKLLYTASMPIMLLTALISNILLVSQALYIQFGDNVLVRALGVWEPLTESNQLFVTSGAAYFLTAPRGLVDAITHPLHTAVYATIVIIACAYLSKLWMEISGSSTRDVSKQLRDQQLSIAGYRDSSIYKELNRVIPSAATFGGATLAIISVSADIFGAIGTGAGVLMSATIIFQYFELFVKEQMEGNMSMEQMMSGMQ